jgi:hypothetical protein
VGGTHVDDGDVGLLARSEAADLVVKIPHPRAVEGGQSKHVPLMEVDGRDLLSTGQCWGVGPGTLRCERQAHL